MPAGGNSPKFLLPDLPPQARVLLIRLRSLGDLLLTTQALRALKQWRSDLRVSLVLYKEFAPILHGNPDVEELIELERGQWTAVLSLVRRIRQQQFHVCFNLHGNAFSAWLTRVSGAPYRLAAGRFRHRWAYTAMPPASKVIFGREQLHSVEDRLAVFYWAGLPPGEIPRLQLFPQSEARQTMRERLSAAGIGPGVRYAVLQPTANFFTKEWPFERYAAIARYLDEVHGLVPVFSCGAGEGGKLDAVAAAYGKPLVRFDPLGIPELVILIERAALFVGNDSGPTHIAAALGRPIVVLFGSSDSVAWRPWGALHAVVQNDYSCNPCRGDRCYAFEQPECILSISVGQVRSVIERVLSAVPTAV